jgi:hypothetical protein
MPPPTAESLDDARTDQVYDRRISLLFAVAVGQRWAARGFRGYARVVVDGSPYVLAARVEVGIPVVSGGGVEYEVINTGELPIMLGEAYEFDRLGSTGWDRVPLPYAFRLSGRRLEAGDRYGLAARVPDSALPGRYRLRKRLDVDRDPHPGYEWVAHQEIDAIEVTAEFEITPG